MKAARLPLAYRDSCGHLLIPLNRCRFEEYYLPWKCEVGQDCRSAAARELTGCTEREAFVREVPVRGVQGACQEDGRVEGGQGRSTEQLMSRMLELEQRDYHEVETNMLHVYIRSRHSFAKTGSLGSGLFASCTFGTRGDIKSIRHPELDDIYLTLLCISSPHLECSR